MFSHPKFITVQIKTLVYKLPTLLCYFSVYSPSSVRVHTLLEDRSISQLFGDLAFRAIDPARSIARNDANKRRVLIQVERRHKLRDTAVELNFDKFLEIVQDKLEYYIIGSQSN